MYSTCFFQSCFIILYFSTNLFIQQPEITFNTERLCTATLDKQQYHITCSNTSGQAYRRGCCERNTSSVEGDSGDHKFARFTYLQVLFVIILYKQHVLQHALHCQCLLCLLSVDICFSLGWRDEITKQ